MKRRLIASLHRCQQVLAHGGMLDLCRPARIKKLDNFCCDLALLLVKAKTVPSVFTMLPCVTKTQYPIVLTLDKVHRPTDTETIDTAQV